MDLEDDHDLLTFTASDARLRAEIAAVAESLGTSAEADRAGLEARLAALRDALTRNSHQAQTKPGETGFLTYLPPKR